MSDDIQKPSQWGYSKAPKGWVFIVAPRYENIYIYWANQLGWSQRIV